MAVGDNWGAKNACLTVHTYVCGILVQCGKQPDRTQSLKQ